MRSDIEEKLYILSFPESCISDIHQFIWNGIPQVVAVDECIASWFGSLTVQGEIMRFDTCFAYRNSPYVEGKHHGYRNAEHYG